MSHYRQLGLDTAGQLGWGLLWSTPQNYLTKSSLSTCSFLVKGYSSSEVLPEPPASANQAHVAQIYNLQRGWQMLAVRRFSVALESEINYE